MPTLVEYLAQLTRASEDLATAAGAAVEARLDYNAAIETKEAAERALTEAKAAHAVVLAALDELT